MNKSMALSYLYNAEFEKNHSGLIHSTLALGTQVPFSGKQSLKAKIQTLGVLTAVVIVSRPFQRRKLGNMYF